MKKEQPNVDSLEPNVDSLRSNVASLESKFKVGDKCIYKGEEAEILQMDINNPYPYLILPKNRFSTWVDESDLEPYTEENKESMEEKELNLCELLKGYEGEKIYLPDEGECKIVSVAENEIELSQEPNRKIILSEDSYIFTRTGFAYAYPSKESFLVNPLNACKAWQEWKEARKPKRWTPQVGERIFFVNTHGAVSQDFCRRDEEGNGNQLKRRAIGNEFRTGKAAETFAKIFRETLAIFHEKNAGRDI